MMLLLLSITNAGCLPVGATTMAMGTRPGTPKHTATTQEGSLSTDPATGRLPHSASPIYGTIFPGAVFTIVARKRTENSVMNDHLVALLDVFDAIIVCPLVAIRTETIGGKTARANALRIAANFAKLPDPSFEGGAISACREDGMLSPL